MKTYIFLLALIIASCTPQQARIIDDILEGEVQTVEKAMADTLGPSPQDPTAKPVVKATVKF